MHSNPRYAEMAKLRKVLLPRVLVGKALSKRLTRLYTNPCRENTWVSQAIGAACICLKMR